MTIGSGGLNIATTSGAITQTGVLTVAGTSSFTAGANAITLTQSNAFTGDVSLNNSGANDVALTNGIALSLATSSVGSGTLALSAVEHLRGSTVTAITAATKKRARTRTVTLGRAPYRLNAGATAAFTIKLDGTAQSLLSTHHHFAAKLTLTPGGAGSPTARRTITLRAS